MLSSSTEYNIHRAYRSNALDSQRGIRLQSGHRVGKRLLSNVSLQLSGPDLMVSGSGSEKSECLEL